MFTGLVAGIGVIREVSRQGRDLRLGILAPFAADGIMPGVTAAGGGIAAGSIVAGDSVAVNGVCLTAEKTAAVGGGTLFTAYVSAETLKNSNLGGLKQGGEVNLELALCLGQRLGGHIVSGHVDGTAVVSAIERRSDSRLIQFECAPELDIYIVNKGSVCVDGVSLTVTGCGPGRFALNIIPETWNATVARNWHKGYAANLEVDMLGKYVAKMLRISTAEQSGAQKRESGLSLDFFIRNGFN